MLNTTVKIAITGSIGSGKSTVAGLFSGWGSQLIDFDVISREILTTDSALQQEIVNRYGLQLTRPDGTLDRFALRSLAFTDNDFRLYLEQLLHPPIRQEAESQFNKLLKSGCRSVTMIIPLLFEKLRPLTVFSATVLIKSSRQNCIDRATRRDSSGKQLIASIFDSQMSPEQKALMADFVIENDSNLQELQTRSRKVFELVHGNQNS